MKKILLLFIIGFSLSSCVVTTAAKVVGGAVSLSYKAVKGTVKGVSWAVSKANGKIDENRLDGTWKIVGVYNGSFTEFEKDEAPDNSFKSECDSGFEQILFKTKKSKFQPVHCSSTKEKWIKYSFDFGKHPITKEKENYIEFQKNNYLTIINVTNSTLVLEGNLMPKYAFSGGKLYLLEKVK